ncbi:MAG: hypothetical protein M1829_004651 [Trizodia sp. TS-e1964]|nr:MAG: hypothetical protein M1829_004651 [Trizodia sp. TS-e1964]
MSWFRLTDTRRQGMERLNLIGDEGLTEYKAFQAHATHIYHSARISTKIGWKFIPTGSLAALQRGIDTAPRAIRALDGQSADNSLWWNVLWNIHNLSRREKKAHKGRSFPPMQSETKVGGARDWKRRHRQARDVGRMQLAKKNREVRGKARAMSVAGPSRARTSRARDTSPPLFLAPSPANGSADGLAANTPEPAPEVPSMRGWKCRHREAKDIGRMQRKTKDAKGKARATTPAAGRSRARPPFRASPTFSPIHTPPRVFESAANTPEPAVNVGDSGAQDDDAEVSVSRSGFCTLRNEIRAERRANQAAMELVWERIERLERRAAWWAA